MKAMMKNKDELDKLYEWCVFIIKCLKQIGDKTSTSQEETEFNKTMNNLLEENIKYNYEAKKITALRKIKNELELLILHLDYTQINELNKKVQDKYGQFIGEDTILLKVNKVLNRGFIKSKNEYRLLMEVIEIYSGDFIRKDFIDKVSSVVAHYEKENRHPI